MNSCTEKERLLVAHDKGFELYIRGVSELAQAVGLMAHAEFEFLSRKVQAARQSLIETRHRLMEHTSPHGVLNAHRKWKSAASQIRSSRKEQNPAARPIVPLYFR
jgi:hypothetical protein